MRKLDDHKIKKLIQGCNRGQPTGGPQIGICNGVQNSRCPGNIRKKYIQDVLTPTSLSWGMGHMEQGHWELFCTATAVQLTSGRSFNISITFNWFHRYVKCCGLALSQGDGSDFNPWCNWEATLPGYSACMRAWRWLPPCHGATPAQIYYGSPVKLEKYGNAGSCGQLWKELEMVQQRKIGAGI